MRVAIMGDYAVVIAGLHALIEPYSDRGDRRGARFTGAGAPGGRRRHSQVLTSLQIADRACISVNSVKTYIRLAYRKIGVERRSQAVLWAAQNGFLPDHKRILLVTEGVAVSSTDVGGLVHETDLGLGREIHRKE